MKRSRRSSANQPTQPCSSYSGTFSPTLAPYLPHAAAAIMATSPWYSPMPSTSPVWVSHLLFPCISVHRPTPCERNYTAAINDVTLYNNLCAALTSQILSEVTPTFLTSALQDPDFGFGDVTPLACYVDAPAFRIRHAHS